MTQLYRRAHRSLLLLFGTALILSSCEPVQPPEEPVDDQVQQAFAAGESTGYTRGRVIGDSAGYSRGYEEGFRAARPSLGGVNKGIWKVVSLIVIVLGALKIVGSLMLFSLSLILDSKTSEERWAKIIATSLSVVVLFWLSNALSAGFSLSLESLLLVPAVDGPVKKLGVGAIAAIATFIGWWALEFLSVGTTGHRYLQTFLVVMSSGMIAVLIPFFVSLHVVPTINGYLLFDIVIGVVVGGITWIVHRLLVEAGPPAAARGLEQAV